MAGRANPCAFCVPRQRFELPFAYFAGKSPPLTGPSSPSALPFDILLFSPPSPLLTDHWLLTSDL